MARDHKNAVKDQTVTGSTGNGPTTFVVAGVAPAGARTCTTGLTDGNTYAMRIENSDQSLWIVGDFTWTNSTSTLTLVTAFDGSSGSGSSVTFASGAKTVTLVTAAADLDTGAVIAGATQKTTLASSDKFALSDVTGNVLKYILASDLRAALLGVTVSLGGLAGAESLKAVNVTSAVNRIEANGATTGNSPSLVIAGSDTNTTFLLSSRGTGGVDLYTNSLSQKGFGVAHVASAVNNYAAYGQVTGGPPALTVVGSDSIIPANVSSKANGAVNLLTGSNSLIQFAAVHVASAVNYALASGSASGGAIAMTAFGSDSAIPFYIAAKGTAGVSLVCNGNIAVSTSAPSNAVNYTRIDGAPTSSGAALIASGSDSTITFGLSGKDVGGVGLYTRSFGALQLYVGDAAGGAAVNYWVANGSVSGTGVGFAAGGSDAAVAALVQAKGTASVYLSNGNGNGLLVAAATSAVNYVQSQGTATGVSPGLTAQGSDSNLDFTLGAKGTGSILGNAAFGYQSGIGVGGAVTQATSKTTGVTLNTVTGKITTATTSITPSAQTTFTLSNSLVASTDTVYVSHTSGGTQGAYALSAFCTSGAVQITIRNLTAGALSEAIVLTFELRRTPST